MSTSFLMKPGRYFSSLEFVRPGGYVEIWHITWPLILTNASSTLMLLCNRMFLAKNNLEDVTASVAAGQLFFCAMAFFLITTSFTGTLVAQHFGNEDRSSCIHSAWNGFYFGIMVSLILLLLLPHFAHWVFQFGKLSESIRTREEIYFLHLIPSACFVCMEAPFLSFFTATGRTRVVAAVKITSCFLSIPLNYIMIFGKLGFPAWGIRGAAIASSTASFCSLAMAAAFFLLQDQSLWPSRRYGKPDFPVFGKLLVFGTPGGLQACIRNIAFALVLFSFGYLGDKSLTAASLAMTINNIAFIPLLGLMDASSVITGKYIGKRQISVAASISGRAFRMLSVYMTVVALFYIFCPEMLIRFFAPSEESAISLEEIMPSVKIILLFQIFQNYFDGMRFIVSGSLRGAGDTRIPLLLSIATSWTVQVPAAILLTQLFPSPVWLAWGGAVTFYVFVDAVVIQLRKNTGAWKKIKVIDLPDEPPEDKLKSAA